MYLIVGHVVCPKRTTISKETTDTQMLNSKSMLYQNLLLLKVYGESKLMVCLQFSGDENRDSETSSLSDCAGHNVTWLKLS